MGEIFDSKERQAIVDAIGALVREVGCRAPTEIWTVIEKLRAMSGDERPPAGLITDPLQTLQKLCARCAEESERLAALRPELREVAEDIRARVALLGEAIDLFDQIVAPLGRPSHS